MDCSDADASVARTGPDTAAPGGERRPVEIWTDGGCKPNPGPGGWAALLRFGDHER